MAGWRQQPTPVVKVDDSCRECGAKHPEEERYPPGGFCPTCAAAIRACLAEPRLDAVELWNEVAAKIDGQGAVTFALVSPVLRREDGTLVLTARRPIRRWMKRRYSEWLPAAAGCPVEILPPREAAAELAAKPTERSPA